MKKISLIFQISFACLFLSSAFADPPGKFIQLPKDLWSVTCVSSDLQKIVGIGLPGSDVFAGGAWSLSKSENLVRSIPMPNMPQGGACSEDASVFFHSIQDSGFGGGIKSAKFSDGTDNTLLVATNNDGVLGVSRTSTWIATSRLVQDSKIPSFYYNIKEIWNLSTNAEIKILNPNWDFIKFSRDERGFYFTSDDPTFDPDKGDVTYTSQGTAHPFIPSSSNKVTYFYKYQFGLGSVKLLWSMPTNITLEEDGSQLQREYFVGRDSKNLGLVHLYSVEKGLIRNLDILNSKILPDFTETFDPAYPGAPPETKTVKGEVELFKMTVDCVTDGSTCLLAVISGADYPLIYPMNQAVYLRWDDKGANVFYASSQYMYKGGDATPYDPYNQLNHAHQVVKISDDGKQFLSDFGAARGLFLVAFPK